MAVVGAGASGAEIASAYARLGVEVLLFEALERVLPTEDADISKVVERGLKRQGMQIHTEHAGRGHRASDEHGVTFTYGEQSGEVDWLVIAAGRGPDVEALGLDAAGVKLDRERTDRGRRSDAHERGQASTRSATSCTGPALAHKASDEGVIAVEDAAGRDDSPDRVHRHPPGDVLHPERRAASA